MLKLNGKIAERPQHMLMRVSIGIHHEDLEAAIEVHNMLLLIILYVFIDMLIMLAFYFCLEYFMLLLFDCFYF